MSFAARPIQALAGGLGVLQDLSLVRAGLPVIPGATLQERLLNARAMAQVALQKYVPELRFDVAWANQVMREIETWQDRNGLALEAAMATPTVQSLPEAIRLNLDRKKAQGFVIASFTQAAYGMGPWASGRVELEAQKGQLFDEPWARADAEDRITTFASIVKMDQAGYLAQLFSSESLGSPVAIAGIIALAVVAAVACFLLFMYTSKRTEVNNRLMADLCKKAQDEGDAATVQKCIEMTADLQKGDAGTLLIGEIGKIAMIAAALYIGGKLFLDYSTRRST